MIDIVIDLPPRTRLSSGPLRDLMDAGERLYLQQGPHNDPPRPPVLDIRSEARGGDVVVVYTLQAAFRKEPPLDPERFPQ